MEPNRDSSSPSLALVAAIVLACLTAIAATAVAADGETDRVSVASGGAAADGNSFFPSISADGRFVAFSAEAANLVPGDTNNVEDVFVHDRETGSTERVSVSSAGVQTSSGASEASISADGRFVAFSSFSSDLTPGDTNGDKDVFVHDRPSDTTERVSLASVGSPANDRSQVADISADGRFVAFESVASNLVAGDTNNTGDIFVRDRQSASTERVSVGSGGAQGDEASSEVSISADGLHVAFVSAASTLVPGDTNLERDLFVRDLETDTTARISVSDDEVQGNDASFDSAISADGRFVAFSSSATNLVPGDTNAETDAFLRDRQGGSTERVSVAPPGRQAEGTSSSASISADGRFVAFASLASNLITADSNGAFDVFVRDRQADGLELASGGLGGGLGDDTSFSPVISADGCLVAFPSVATNLVTGDTNGFQDIFVHDLRGCPDPGDPGGDTVPPELKLRAKPRQRIGKPVEVRASCDEPCTVSVQGRAKPKDGKRLKLRTARAELATGETEKLRLRPRRSVARKLERAGRARATIRATATDLAGNQSTATRKLRLRSRG